MPSWSVVWCARCAVHRVQRCSCSILMITVQVLNMEVISKNSMKVRHLCMPTFAQPSPAAESAVLLQKLHRAMLLAFVVAMAINIFQMVSKIVLVIMWKSAACRCAYG